MGAASGDAVDLGKAVGWGDTAARVVGTVGGGEGWGTARDGETAGWGGAPPRTGWMGAEGFTWPEGSPLVLFSVFAVFSTRFSVSWSISTDGVRGSVLACGGGGGGDGFEITPEIVAGFCTLGLGFTPSADVGVLVVYATLPTSGFTGAVCGCGCVADA